MNKLNKIFFGPAGTGKTREANIEAVKLVCKSQELKKYQFNKDNYTDIQKYLKDFTKLSKISDKVNEKIIEKINNLSLSVDSLINTLNFNDIKALVGDGQDREGAKKNITEYRIYPLIEMITFHPSYSYQDFVEGISVETNKDTNEIEYKVKDGIFKKICDRAENNPSYNYVLIIDEINRGDIASIFGELFTLLEDNKRKENQEELGINLPYSKDKKGNPKKLFVPKNLYILATMNTVDKSIALIDVALRRRFDFIECMPKYQDELPSLKSVSSVNLSKLLETMNKRITILKNEHYQIGHSYFLDIKNLNDLRDIMIKKIIPLLQEYFYDDWKSICAVLNQSYQNPKDNKILIKEEISNKLFKPEYDELITYNNPNKIIFRINKKFSEEDIKKVYE